MEIENSENKEIENSSRKVNEIRCKLRENLSKTRDVHRSTAFDKNRFLESEILTETDVVGLSGRIKRRKHATEEDLIKLAAAFYQSEANISAFLKITGAIKIIIKEFIGIDTVKQMLAAQVLLNLSIGHNDTCCSKIATFAGAYLMIYMRNLTCLTHNKICIWTVQNLVSSNGHKSLDILMSQELLQNILYIITNAGDDELVHESMVLLDLIIEKKFTGFSMDEKEEITEIVFNYIRKHNSDYIGLQCLQRIIILDTWNKEASKTVELVNLISKNFKHLPIDDDHRSLYFSIKILSKMFRLDSSNLELFLQNLLAANVKLSSLINQVVNNLKFIGLTKDLIQFAGFIVEHPEAANYLAIDDIVNNLNLPKFFEF